MSKGVFFSRLLEDFIVGPCILNLRMLGKVLQLKPTYRPFCVSLFSVISKVFEKLLNNRIVDHLEICELFSDLQYGFRSSRSTADLLTVASDRIARAFNRSGATRAVALDISKAFDKVWHAGLLHNLKSNDFWPYFFFSQCNRQVRVFMDGKSSH